jgi:predicted PurR-regulated permease PerM
MDDDLNLRIPFSTMVKVALFLLLCMAVMQLWSVVLILIVSSLLAVMLDPLTGWLVRHRLRRGVAVGLIAILLFGIVAAFLFGIVPTAAAQVRELGKEAPEITNRLVRMFPRASPVVAFANARLKVRPSGVQIEQWLTRGLVAGRYALEGLTTLVLILVFTIYLLLEGRKAMEWLLRYCSPETRSKIEQTIVGVKPVILAFMRGQLIICSLCATVTLVTLSLLHVPAAVPLAVLAFFADLIPVLGTILMTVPAAIVTLLIGPTQALIVVAVYLTYHMVETYLVIPRVYGRQMRLSTLTVLLAIVIGGALQGAVGAVLVLPFVATYPIVERIWWPERVHDIRT